MEINKIYNENCLETMAKRIVPESVDLVITSPPYNLGKKHHTQNHIFDSYDIYNDNLPEEEYQQKQINILNKLFDVVNSTGSLIYNHKNRIKKGKQITPYEWLLKTKWIIKQELVWHNGSPNFDKIRFYPQTERIYWLAKKPETKLYNVISHHDIFSANEWYPEGTDKIHKRSFPEKMVIDLLKCFPDTNLIYDPFMGSGTTAVAALKSDKNFIGSEISEEYCKIAEERIKVIQEEILA